MHKFKALDNNSQMCGGKVIYIDENAEASLLFESAWSRLIAVNKLHNELMLLNNVVLNIEAITEVSAILLSDAVFILGLAGEKLAELEREHKNKTTGGE